MEQPQPSQSLHEHLSIISDPRIDRTKDHLLIDTLMIAVLAMLCGAEHFTDFADFGKAKRDWLRAFLALPNGIPSHDTFRRIFSLLDPAQFAEAFRNWTESLRKAITQEIVAIDGKTARRSHDHFKGRKAIHVVSATRPSSSRPESPPPPRWARENGLVLGQIMVEEKSNEPSGAR